MEDDYSCQFSSREKGPVLTDKEFDKAITISNNKNNITAIQRHPDESQNNDHKDTNLNNSTRNTSVGDIGGDTTEAGYGVSITGELLVSRDGSFSYTLPLVHQHHHTSGVSGVAIHHHHQEHHHHHRVLDEVTSFPAAMSYATSEAAKSDIATICSGSVVEDIDISSVMSGDMGNVHPTTPSSSQVVVGGGGGSSGGGRRKERVVESTLNIWKQQNIYPSQQHTQPTSLHQSPPGSSSGLLNDMGPPLSRSLLLKCTGLTLGTNSALSASASGCGERNSTGTISRAGSVRSYGSQATSDLVHVDTDDCGGSLIESEGKCSRTSVEEAINHHSTASPIENQQPKYSEADQDQQHNYLEKEKLSYDAVESDPEECQDDDCEKRNMKYVSTSTLSNANNFLRDARLSGPHSHGRTSPGGTVYKGRGVRRYQGRYMHLPLKRFHQNGVTAALTHHEYVDDTCVGGEGVINDGDAIGRDSGQSLSSNMYEGDSTAFTQNNNGRDDQRHQQYHEYQTQRRSWSRSRSRSRSRERIEGHCGGDERGGRNRFWNHRQSKSQPRPLPARTSNYNKNRSPSWGRDKWKASGSGDNCNGRWRNNHRGWHGGNNCGNAKGNNRSNESTTWHRNGKNSNFSRRGEGGGHYRGGHQSQGMTPRDVRHNRDRRK